MTKRFPAFVIMPKLRLFEQISIKIRRLKIAHISVFLYGSNFLTQISGVEIVFREYLQMQQIFAM